MKKIKYILGSLAFIGIVSCSQEAPFEVEQPTGEGRVLSSAINVDLRVDEPATRSLKESFLTRALPDVGEFTIEFISAESSEVVETYTYSKMPEIVILPVGEYKVKASYGENLEAAFDNPYYEGSSESFTIKEEKIVSVIDPILCTLANVRVSVSFDSNLPADSKVTVVVGDSRNESLVFTPTTTKDGYFKYAEGSTSLAATYEGTIDGEDVIETKTYNGVKPGLYYRITFKLHKVETVDPENPEDPNDGDNQPTVDGSLEADAASPETDNWGFKLNASMVIEDLTDEGISVEPEQEVYLEDDRPGSNPSEKPENPSGPSIPDDPNTGDDEPSDPDTQTPPEIRGIGSTSVTSVNVNPESFEIEIISSSEEGIEKFIVNINSDVLTPEELEQVNLKSEIDLINPGSMAQDLSDLGFPVGAEVKGAKKISLTISPQFLGLLKILGEASHEFKFTVADANGETVTSVFIVYQ